MAEYFHHFSNITLEIMGIVPRRDGFSPSSLSRRTHLAWDWGLPAAFLMVLQCCCPSHGSLRTGLALGVQLQPREGFLSPYWLLGMNQRCRNTEC